MGFKAEIRAKSLGFGYQTGIWTSRLRFGPQDWVLGKIRQKLTEFGRNWLKLTDFGRIWQDLAESGRIWQNLAAKGGGTKKKKEEKFLHM